MSNFVMVDEDFDETSVGILFPTKEFKQYLEDKECYSFWDIADKNECYRVDFGMNHVPTQCGMDFMFELVIRGPGCYQHNISIKEKEKVFELLSKFIYKEDDEEYHIPGEEEGVFTAGRILLSDSNNSPCDTRYFCRYFELPEARPIRNPNSGNIITHWYFDLVDDLPHKAFWGKN